MSKPHSISRLTVAYDGSPFAGWAVQPGERTVEGELAAIPNFGKKSIDEVIETLSQRGLTLRTD